MYKVGLLPRLTVLILWFTGVLAITLFPIEVHSRTQVEVEVHIPSHVAFQSMLVVEHRTLKITYLPKL